MATSSSIFSRRDAVRDLNKLGVNWKAGVTVQILVAHPYIPTSIHWVHNVLETKPTKIARYNFQPKPDGWGNGGGGLERLISVQIGGEVEHLTELEMLAMRRPNHPVLTDPSLTPEQKLIVAGGLREFIDETGFGDIDIRTDYPGVFLNDYVYPPFYDKDGNFSPGGHRKITLWGELKSFKPDRSIFESYEIDKTDWFDLSVSLPKLFFNLSPERPYWSHVRAVLRDIRKIYIFERDAAVNGVIPNLPRRIHPSWWYIFPVGKGDPRFPEFGYRLSVGEWYGLFQKMVARRMEEADNDFLVKFLGLKLDRAMRRQDQEKEAEVQPPSGPGPLVTEAVENSEDAEGVPLLKDMIEKEDAEYARWLSEELGI